MRQEQQAHEGFRAMDDGEAALHARVVAALGNAPIEVEVDRETVTLHGAVRDADTITRLEEQARTVDGVGSVVNRLVVAP